MIKSKSRKKRLKEFLDDGMALDDSLDDYGVSSENEITKSELIQFYLPNVKEISVLNTLDSFSFSIKPKRIRKAGMAIRIINRLGDTLQIEVNKISPKGYFNEFGELVFYSKDKRNQIIFKGTF